MSPAKHLAICAEIQQQYESRIKVLLDRIAKLQTHRQPLTEAEIDDEFELYASQFDTFSNDWQDMSAGDYFKAGFKAARGIKGENNGTR